MLYDVIQRRKFVWKSNHMEEGYLHGELVLTSAFSDERYSYYLLLLLLICPC